MLLNNKNRSLKQGITSLEFCVVCAVVLLTTFCISVSFKDDSESIANKVSNEMNDISNIVSNNESGDSSLPDNPDEEGWTEEQKCKYYGGSFTASICTCPEGRELSNGWCLKKSAGGGSDELVYENMKITCLAANHTWDDDNKKCIYNAKDKCEYGFIWSGTTCVAADEEAIGDTSKFAFVLNDDETGYIIAGVTDTAQLSIPPTYKSLPVVGIGVEAFKTALSLRAIEIPASVTYIDTNAFNGLTLLQRVDMKAPSIKIGDGAFQGCTSLSKINLENAVQIGNSAFAGCTALASVDLSKVVVLGDSTFSGCTALDQIGNIDNIKNIGVSAFSGCTQLAFTWTPHDGFEKAGADSFKQTKMKLSLSSITTIPEGAFANIGLNTGNEPFIIPISVTSIGSNAFEGNTFRYVKFEEGTQNNFPNYGSTIFGTSNALMLIPAGTYEQAGNVGKPLNPYALWDGSKISSSDYKIVNGVFKQYYRYSVVDDTPTKETSSSSTYYNNKILYKYEYKFGALIVPDGVKSLSSESIDTYSYVGSRSSSTYYDYTTAIARLPIRFIVFPPSFTSFGASGNLTNGSYSESDRDTNSYYTWGVMRDMTVFDIYFTNKNAAVGFNDYAFNAYNNFTYEGDRYHEPPKNPGSISTAVLHVPVDPTVCQKYKDAVTGFFTYDKTMVDHVVCDVTDEMIAAWYN